MHAFEQKFKPPQNNMVLQYSVKFIYSSLREMELQLGSLKLFFFLQE